MIGSVVDVRNADRAAGRQSVVLLVEFLARVAQRVVGPVIAVQVLVAEIEEGAAVIVLVPVCVSMEMMPPA